MSNSEDKHKDPFVDKIKARVSIFKAIKMLRSKDENRFIKAATYLASEFCGGKPNQRWGDTESKAFLLQFVTHLIDIDQAGWAATLVWPSELITFGPESVQDIWNELNEPGNNEILIMGAGSLGKSFTVAIWAMLDWIYDPYFTCFKVVSLTKEHAKRNVFAHMKNLHANSLIPLPGVVTSTSIDMERKDGTRDDKQGIHLVAIPQGENGKGRLQGFHPVTRIEDHPKYGKLSRIRVILDEAEEIPPGVWDDLDNTLLSKTPDGHVKVIASTNPVERTSKFGIRAEPEGGWASLDVETAYKWTSKLGFKVLRIDGARFENVVQKKIVYPGFLTYEGYMRYLAMGPGSPTYWTMARGWFPEQGMAGIVIPQNIFDNAKGQFIFHGRTFYVMSIDLAFSGGDLAIATIGRWGFVTGWIDLKGRVHNFPTQKHGLQIENQFELKKGNTVYMVKEILNVCRNLKIRDDRLALDATGAGSVVFDMFKARAESNETNEREQVVALGINWGSAATEEKILDESEHTAKELYRGIVTEMWFAGRQFMEFDMVKIGPLVKTEKLEKQMVGRRYKHVKELVAVESKDEYKARTQEGSPDEADSFVMAVHLVRMRKQFIARMIAENPINEEIQVSGSDHGIVDKLSFMNFGSS